MPLDEREQQILDDIERHLLEEDPSLGESVGGLQGKTRQKIRLPLLGLVAGIVLVLFTFRGFSFLGLPVLAVFGFLIMVLSSTALVQALRGSSGFPSYPKTGLRKRYQQLFRRRDGQ